MTKKIITLFLFLLIFGCQRHPQDKLVLIRVNDYELTKEEFEEEFKGSIFGSSDTQEARRDFLNNLVNQKLILQDAQFQGIDKQKGFLKTIEKFWEQSLLKIALDKKSKDIAGSVSVNETLIREAYQNMVNAGKTDKSFEQLREQIKWELTRLKETQLMNDWIEQLRSNAQIKINYDLLKSGKEVAK